MATAEVRMVLAQLPYRLIAPDREIAFDAGSLIKHTECEGLSLGDRFCLAAARGLGATVLTADRAWARIADAVEVRVELIR